jgi:uncharacterized protein YcbK (DUF882 family)
MRYTSFTDVSPRLWRWDNFSPRELACRCGGRFCKGAYWHDPEFLDRLEALRAAMGAPLVLTSAHRCPLWNAAVGGAPRSMHKTIAADVRLKGHDADTLIKAAADLGFAGIGRANSFIHLDRRTTPARWFYK